MGSLSHPGLGSFHSVRMSQIRVHDSDCELTLIGWLELKIKQVNPMVSLRSYLYLKSEIWETKAGGSKIAKIYDLPQLQYCEFKRARAGVVWGGEWWEGYLCALWAIVTVTVLEHK